MEDSNKCEGVGKLKNPHLQIGYKTVLYRKIPNVSPGLIEVRKYILGGLYSGGLIFGRHFVLMSEYQDLKNHCFT